MKEFLQNEWCGNCDWEGETPITGINRSRWVYEWTCPKCGMEHVVENDEEIWRELKAEWYRSGWNGKDWKGVNAVGTKNLDKIT